MSSRGGRAECISASNWLKVRFEPSGARQSREHPIESEKDSQFHTGDISVMRVQSAGPCGTLCGHGGDTKPFRNQSPGTRRKNVSKGGFAEIPIRTLSTSPALAVLNDLPRTARYRRELAHTLLRLSSDALAGTAALPTRTRFQFVWRFRAV